MIISSKLITYSSQTAYNHSSRFEDLCWPKSHSKNLVSSSLSWRWDSSSEAHRRFCGASPFSFMSQRQVKISWLLQQSRKPKEVKVLLTPTVFSYLKPTASVKPGSWFSWHASTPSDLKFVVSLTTDAFRWRNYFHGCVFRTTFVGRVSVLTVCNLDGRDISSKSDVRIDELLKFNTQKVSVVQRSRISHLQRFDMIFL